MAAFSLCNQISKLLLISRFYAGADVTSYRNPTSWCSGVCIIPQQIARFRLWKGNFIHVHHSFEFFNTDIRVYWKKTFTRLSFRFFWILNYILYKLVERNAILFVNYSFKICRLFTCCFQYIFSHFQTLSCENTFRIHT